MKSLIWKELRENARWLPVGAFVAAISCYMAYPSHNGGDLLLATNLIGYFTISAPLLAFALGVVQSYRDLQPGPGAYLNHRSVTASDVFLAKVFSGFALYLLAISVPMLALATWIAYQGMWSFPMRPAQVIPSLVFAMASFSMHPAAMLMLSRSASWWGTRLFPLVPAGTALVPFYAYLHQGGLYWAAVCFVVAVAALAWVVAIARHGRQTLACDPPASSLNPSLSQRWLMPSYLLMGSFISLVVSVFFVVASIEEASRSNIDQHSPYTRLAVEENSDALWFVTRLGQYDSIGVYSTSTLGGDVVKHGATVDARSTAAKDRELYEFGDLARPNAGGADGFFSSLTQIGSRRLVVAYDSRGYLLRYELNPKRRWVNTIAANGVFPAGELKGTPFEQDPLKYQWSFIDLSNNRYPTPLIDSKSISFIDSDPLEIRTVLQTQIDGVALVRSKRGNAPRLIILSGSELQEYKLIDESDSDEWYVELESEDAPLALKRNASRGLRLDIELIRTLRLPPTFDNSEGFRIGWTPQALYIAKQRGEHDKQLIVHRLQEGKASEIILASIAPDSLTKPENDKVHPTFVIMGMLPGSIFLTAFGIESYLIYSEDPSSGLFQGIAFYPVATGTVVISFIAITLVSWWLVRVTAYRRGLSRRQTLIWSFAVPLLGLAAPLSIIAIYRLVHRETCPKCNASRRVDTMTCEHCGAPWESPATEGIEIRDLETASQTLQAVTS